MAQQKEKLKDKYVFVYKERNDKFTEEVVRRLEEAASVRLNVSSSCAYAGISRDTYYRWLKEWPQLSDRLDDLREKPIMKAKRTIVSQLNDVSVAFKYLEKENPEDYGDRIKIEHSTGTLHPEDDEIRLQLKEKLRANIAKRWKNKQNENIKK